MESKEKIFNSDNVTRASLIKNQRKKLLNF